MKRFEWNEAKNKLLRKERQVSFEEITEAVKAGKVLDRYDHPNKKKYHHQEIMVVEIDNYAYLVPFVENDEKYFVENHLQK